MPTDFPDIDISHISGNAPDGVKRIIGNPSALFRSSKARFGEHIFDRVVVSEVSYSPKVEEPSRDEAKVVCLLTVEEDMLNSMLVMHGGCSAFLVDMCSTLPVIALSVKAGKSGLSVSQSITMVYHSPAALGDKLRIVSTTMTLGARAESARCEIWNTTHRRLVASGVHIKMAASPPPESIKSKL